MATLTLRLSTAHRSAGTPSLPPARPLPPPPMRISWLQARFTFVRSPARSSTSTISLMLPVADAGADARQSLQQQSRASAPVGSLQHPTSAHESSGFKVVSPTCALAAHNQHRRPGQLEVQHISRVALRRRTCTQATGRLVKRLCCGNLFWSAQQVKRRLFLVHKTTGRQQETDKAPPQPCTQQAQWQCVATAWLEHAAKCAA